MVGFTEFGCLRFACFDVVDYFEFLLLQFCLFEFTMFWVWVVGLLV